MTYCSWNEIDHSLSSDDEIGNYQESDFEILSTNQKNKNVGPSLEPVFLIKNSTAEKIVSILKRFSILLVHGEKFSTFVKEDLKKDTKELLHTLIELPIRSDEQNQSNQSSTEFRFKITMEEKNKMIDQLIKNKDYVSSESVSKEIKKDLVSINYKLITSLFHQSLRPIEGNEIYDFNVKPSDSLNDSSSGHQETSETQTDVNLIKYFDETKDTPPEHEDIWKAIKEQDLKAVDYFLRIKQIDPNLKDSYNSTLLHRASSYGNLEIVKYLVSKGADIHARDNWSNQPLHWACESGKLEIVKYFFFELRMDPNLKGYRNKTCLHKAVWSNNLELVKFLVENGAKKSLHEKTKYKRTPLEYAEICNVKKELIEYLRCLY